MPTLQHGELLAQGEILEEEAPTKPPSKARRTTRGEVASGNEGRVQAIFPRHGEFFRGPRGRSYLCSRAARAENHVETIYNDTVQWNMTKWAYIIGL
jgi:hypothetical protein